MRRESSQNRAPHIDPRRPGAPSTGLPAPNRQITWDRRKSWYPNLHPRHRPSFHTVCIVKDYVRSRRQSVREAFVPLHHPPGHAQVDFGEAVVEVGGRREKVAFFCPIPTSGSSRPIRGRRRRPSSTGMCMPSPSSAGFRNRCSTTTTAAWCRAFWRTGRAGGRGSSAGSCRITSCAIVTGAQARGTTRARWRVWWALPRRNFMVPLPRFASWEAFNLRLEEQCRRRRAISCAGTERPWQ